MTDECTCETPRPEGNEDRRSTGACAEAQADGVPCPTPSTQCEICGKAVRREDA